MYAADIESNGSVDESSVIYSKWMLNINFFGTDYELISRLITVKSSTNFKILFSKSKKLDHLIGVHMLTTECKPVYKEYVFGQSGSPAFVVRPRLRSSDHMTLWRSIMYIIKATPHNSIIVNSEI